MITGFNTDIEYKGVTYHVQTEDKGVSTPLILSLVYDRGTILASKRSPYNDLLLPTFDEKALSERLQKQHKLICAAVRAGRIDDLKRMMAKEFAARQREIAAQKEVKVAAENQPAKVPRAAASLPLVQPKTADSPPPIFRENRQPDVRPKETLLDLPKAPFEEIIQARVPQQREEQIWDFPLGYDEEVVIIDAVQIVEEEIILPDAAVKIIEDFREIAAPGKLKIEIPKGTIFKSGERKIVSVTVRRANSKNGLDATPVMVKLLGAAFAPLVFHAETDVGGVATLDLQLPVFRSGRAAILIKATSDGEEAELRRVIRHS